MYLANFKYLKTVLWHRDQSSFHSASGRRAELRTVGEHSRKRSQTVQ